MQVPIYQQLFQLIGFCQLMANLVPNNFVKHHHYFGFKRRIDSIWL